jgi:hypothetical protein
MAKLANQQMLDHGILYGLPQAPFTSENILTEVDAETKLQTELISDKELQKTNTKPIRKQ